MKKILKALCLIFLLLCKTIYAACESDDDKYILMQAPALFYRAAQAAKRIQEIHDDLYKDVATIRSIHESLKAAEASCENLIRKNRLLEDALIASDLEKRRKTQAMSLLFAGLDCETRIKFKGLCKKPQEIFNICQAESIQRVKPRTARVIASSHHITSTLDAAAQKKGDSPVVFQRIGLPQQTIFSPRKTVTFAKAHDHRSSARKEEDDQSDREEETEFKHAKYH